MSRIEPTSQQLFTALITTTLFEALGLFIGATLFSLSREFDLPALIFVGLAAWFLSMWAENYSVSELVNPRFSLSKPLSILMMSLAEFATWTIWLIVVLQIDLHWIASGVILLVLTHIHHTTQFCFFYSDAPFAAGLRNPILLLASAVEALAGQWLIVQVLRLDGTQMNLSNLLLPLVGLLVLFTVEHIIGGQVKPSS